MLSQKEISFLQYWEAHRVPFSSPVSKLVRGMPMALLFGLPIILSVAVVYLFFPDWYTKISAATSGSLLVVTIAVFCAVLFFAFFRMHFQWEMNEQAFQELKSKQQRAGAAIQ